MADQHKDGGRSVPKAVSTTPPHEEEHCCPLTHLGAQHLKQLPQAANAKNSHLVKFSAS